MEPVTSHLKRLLDFNGRENRQRFWLWVAICYGFQTMLSMLFTMPFMYFLFTKGLSMGSRAARGQGDPKEMFASLQPMMVAMGVLGAIVGFVFILLLITAVVRRLHDRNMSGFWGFPVLALNVVSQISSVSMLASGKLNLTPNPKEPFANVAQTFGLLQFLALGSMIVLIVFLALKGTNGPNKYGPDPLFEL